MSYRRTRSEAATAAMEAWYAKGRREGRAQAREVVDAVRALVAHWDDPHAGANDGRFDAERWENERDRLELAVRDAVTAWERAALDGEVTHG